MGVDVHVEKGNHKMAEDLHVHYRDQPLYPDSGEHTQEVAGWSLLENLHREQWSLYVLVQALRFLQKSCKEVEVDLMISQVWS